MLPPVLKSAAFVLILRDLCVSVVKNYAKQSQFPLAGGWCARHTPRARRAAPNKAKLGRNGVFGEERTLRIWRRRQTPVRANQTNSEPGECAKQSQFARPSQEAGSTIVQNKANFPHRQTVRMANPTGRVAPNKAKLGRNRKPGEERMFRMRWRRCTLVRAKQSQFPERVAVQNKANLVVSAFLVEAYDERGAWAAARVGDR
jgi:hypothetical protein